jgi:hypothetical protein
MYETLLCFLLFYVYEGWYRNNPLNLYRQIQGYWILKRSRHVCDNINICQCIEWDASSIYYTTQNNPWICRYRFNGKVFLTHTRKITKSTVESHTLKHIKNDKTKQPISQRFVLYIEYTLKLHIYTLWYVDVM